MTVKTHPLARGMSVTSDDVKSYREECGVSLMEAQAMAKNRALYARLNDLRHGYFDTEEKIDGLLELLIDSISPEDW